MIPPSQHVNKTVREILRRALEDTAKQVEAWEPATTVQRLRRGDCECCQRLRNNLARHLASYLGRKNKGMRGIYSYNPDYVCGEYQNSDERTSSASGIHLIARTRNKTATLPRVQAFIEQWQRVRTEVLCPQATAMCLSLDVAVVSDREVQARKGYASMLGSLSVKPMQVWSDKDLASKRRSNYA